MRLLFWILAGLGALGLTFVARGWYRHWANTSAMARAPHFEADFSTPEGAILMLEDAYRRHDLEAAVAAKDFVAEARLMLARLGTRTGTDPEVIARTAEALEASFRAFTTAAWPDFSELRCALVAREPHAEGVVAVTEVCRFPDGGTSRERILVAETPNGWRVLNPL